MNEFWNDKIEKRKFEEFMVFLKEKGAYASFLYNVYKRRFGGYDLFPSGTDKTVILKSLIIFAFTWAETKEGHEYWQNLHKEWIDHF